MAGALILGSMPARFKGKRKAFVRGECRIDQRTPLA